MSLGARQRQVAEAEARLVATSERLRQSWEGLKQEGDAALTPGRVVVSGLLTGYFGGMLSAGRGSGTDSPAPARDGQVWPLLLALIQLGTALVPHLLPSLAPAFRAGLAAGAGRMPAADAASNEDSA